MIDNIKKNGRLLLICLLLTLVTLAVFWQVKDHEFIVYDDHLYVTKNPHVQAGLTFQSIKWAFTTSQAANWHPLTWLSHMLDCRLFGLNPAGHHLMNLFFHVANALLLFLVLHRMTKALWQCAFVAALFALHPLHVESVAWVAERKDVLSTFFWMLTMGAYVHYVERPDIRRYFMILLFFVLGLMAKPMLVTLPFVLLLLDYWPLGRLQPAAPGAADSSQASGQKNPGRKKRKAAKRDPTETMQNKTPGFLHRWPVIYSLVREKVPLFAFSAISSVITYSYQQKEGAMFLLHVLPLDARMGHALISYVSYVGKMIWPRNLAVYYPYPIASPVWQIFGAVSVLILITILAIGGAKRFSYLVVGWLWFLGTLVPVIGLVQVGGQAMADRYTYIPFVGLFIMIAWGVPELLKKWQFPTPINGISALTKLSSARKTQKIISNLLKAVLATSAGVILFAFATVTYSQVQYWQDSIALFRRAVSVTTNNSMAYMNLGTALFQKGSIEEAIANYTEAIHINPNYGDAYNNMGNALFMQGKIGEAVFHLREALRIKPDSADAHYNLGNILASQRMFDDAVTHFQEAIRIKPEWAKVHNNLGSVLLLQGKIDEAVVHFREALRIEPDYTMAQDNLRDALRLQGRKQ